MAFKPIQIVINAKDNASAVLGRLEGKIKAVGVAIGAYFGFKAWAGGVQGAAEFEAAMSRVKAATDGTAEEMQQLTKAAQDAGANTKYTSVEAAGALENLAKAGLSAGDSIKALPAVLNLAQAGDIGLAEASEFVTKAVMGMGLAFDDAARVADVLALGANATNTSVTGLAQALSYAAPVANTLGLSLESTVAMMGKLADAGIDASRAGTALNSVMSQFKDPASKFRQELGAAGIVTTDFDKALRQLAASGPAGERAINAVGLEAGPGLRALLNQGMGALDELTEKLNGAKGSADAAAKTMADNFNGSVKSLTSVWSAAVDVLNTPVLPVLRKGIEELTGAIRRSIEDGAVARFGQTLATVFEQGLKSFRAFAGTLNFDAIILRLQVFASETQETLQRIGTYATNAGHTVQLAWGVMTAGTNVVLTAIYGIGAAFTEIASKVISGVAMLREGLASVSFGGLSESFRLAAEDARLSAEAFGEAAQAFRDKAAASLEDTADAAQMARDGWDGLTGALQESQEAIAPVTAEMQLLADAAQEVAAKSAAAVPAMQAKAEADREAAESVKQLRAEYQGLVDSGNLQAAADKLGEIDRIQRDLSGSAQDVAEKTALIDQAYASLGLKTNSELTRLADQARSAFERLAEDGTQPPQRIAQAWEVMAQRAIEANGGIAPSWLKLEASVKGYEVAIDRAGKAVISTEKSTLKATQRMAGGFEALAGSIERVGRNAGEMGERLKDAPAPGGAPNRPSKPSTGPKEYGGLHLTPGQQQRIESLRASGDHLVAANELRKIKWQQEKEQGDKERAERREDNARRSQEALQQVADFKTGGSDRDLLSEMFGKNAVQSVFPKGAITFQMPAAPVAGGLAGVPGAVAQPSAPVMAGGGITQRHEIVINGRDLGAVPTNEEGGAALQRLFQELEHGALTAGGTH